ncbi:MAG TPA: prolyl oligopeptidase family serine peptidase [Nannocystaceae bacterium]|nr:prolyl oligopeptidase family serine peptidase [Nannocystaceae bacterium]
MLFALAMLMLSWLPAAAHAEPGYEKAPAEIRGVLDAPSIPGAFPTSTGGHLVLFESRRYPPIAELAEPMLKLAGVRVQPRNNARRGDGSVIALTLQPLPEGAPKKIKLPKDARIDSMVGNADGTLIAFTNVTDTGVDLWVVDIATARARRIPGVQVNPLLGGELRWLTDQRTLLVKSVPRGRKAAPAAAIAPPGPRVQQSQQVASASSTYESRDLLRTPHDADLFEYYMTSQLVSVHVPSGRVQSLGAPAVLDTVWPSPDGKHILVRKVLRPYSFTRAWGRFAASVELWDRDGKVEEKLVEQPVADAVPIDGVPTFARDHQWRTTAPATLLWVEALDGGDTHKPAKVRDRVMSKPFGKPAVELMRTTQRFAGFEWIDGGSEALAHELEVDKHRRITRLVDVDAAKPTSKLVWDINYDDQYGDPGNPIYRVRPDGTAVIRKHDGAIFLSGSGATPGGYRPFIDRLALDKLATERLFRSDKDALESFAGTLDPEAGTFLTRRQTPSDPPNVFRRTLGAAIAKPAKGEAARSSTSVALTAFTDPAPILRTVGKKLVTYKRADGVPLSFTLYLPPDYKQGTRLPTLLWAYPQDFTDPSAAGQVRSSPQEFTSVGGASPVFLALAGYAVLADAAMPVIGPTEGAYDTFAEQIEANARAAIDKAVELGVTDRDRVAVAGHSHGALMTANLLIYTDLFRAGVARSGAYNHTLRPFGFQNEHRTLYQAEKTYLALSPVLHADEVDEPLLIIHGEIDANPGTTPQQSEKLFEAIRGTGGTAKLVMLPHESHGYVARESIEHVLAETIGWLDTHVKNAGPRAKKQPKPATKPTTAGKPKAETRVAITTGGAQSKDDCRDRKRKRKHRRKPRR